MRSLDNKGSLTGGAGIFSHRFFILIRYGSRTGGASSSTQQYNDLCVRDTDYWPPFSVVLKSVAFTPSTWHGAHGNLLTLLILFDVCSCKQWSLTRWEEHRLRTFDNKVVMKVFGPKQEHKNEDSCIIRSLTILTLHTLQQWTTEKWGV